MCAIPKPSGGDRVVALIAMVIRVLARCRSWRLGEWDHARAGYWDSAIAGCSALKAAVWRSFMDETAGLAGIACATAMIDIEKFFDSLDECLLIQKLLELEAPHDAVGVASASTLGEQDHHE